MEFVISFKKHAFKYIAVLNHIVLIAVVAALSPELFFKGVSTKLVLELIKLVLILKDGSDVRILDQLAEVGNPQETDKLGQENLDRLDHVGCPS